MPLHSSPRCHGRAALWILILFTAGIVLMLPGRGIWAEAVPDRPSPAPSDRSSGQDDRGPGSLDELREKRQKSQDEFNAVTGQLGRGAPAEATQEELQERHALLEQILRAYDEQVNDG